MHNYTLTADHLTPSHPAFSITALVDCVRHNKRAGDPCWKLDHCTKRGKTIGLCRTRIRDAALLYPTLFTAS